jgi:hypothetical protein
MESYICSWAIRDGEACCRIFRSARFFTEPFADDAFGGPNPDNAHLTGVILRLEPDGTAPTSNPFFAVGAAVGGEAGANIQKIFSYGHRNGFGMAFDPISGNLWETENAEDAYSELNRVIPGMNGGWVQLAGPLSRMSDWKFIETTMFGSSSPAGSISTDAQRLQRDSGVVANVHACRAPYTSIPSSAGDTRSDPPVRRSLPAMHSDRNTTAHCGSVQPEAFRSWRQRRQSLSDQADARPSARRCERRSRLADHVADNLFRAQKFDGTESESLQIGTGFGTTTDIEQGPDGNLYVVSVTDNAIYKISRKP